FIPLATTIVPGTKKGFEEARLSSHRSHVMSGVGMSVIQGVVNKLYMTTTLFTYLYEAKSHRAIIISIDASKFPVMS
ncbi:hypothetical protein HAX54_046161, partial [Datura stramonium]|nr:hypothetical protein [Datura stramonium]